MTERELVVRDLEKSAQRFEDRKGDFLQRFDVNPETALEWELDGVVAAQVYYVMAQDVLTYPDLIEGLEWGIEEITRQIMRSVCTSTSMTTNAVQLAKREAYVKLLPGYRQALDRIKADEPSTSTRV